MTKQAHITSDPQVAVGDRTLALCGKAFKVKVLWSDTPRDKVICRDCVDLALDAMTEADSLIQHVRRQALRLQTLTDLLGEALTPDEFGLDLIADEREQWQVKRDAKALAKADRKRKQQTCTCTWTDPETFTEDPNCPIHGEEDRAAIEPPVAPPE